MSEERVPACSKPLSYVFTYILCLFIHGRLEIFRYRFSYTWIFSHSKNKRERQIIVQNSISNFQPKHQNRKLASRHFAAKLDPKQKVYFVQRKMFCFCLKKEKKKKKAVTGNFFSLNACPKVQCLTSYSRCLLHYSKYRQIFTTANVLPILGGG